jgi:thioredoxin-dependent peroxiredoxin
MVSVGTTAPLFTLRDQDGNEHALEAYRGKWVLLYFYPKDNTPGCTKQACVIRDAFPQFKEVSANVFGISADTVSSHKKFADAHALPFPLLADEEKEIVKLYGVWGEKKFMGKTFAGIRRTSFLIDPQGNVRKIYENVKPENHAREVIADLAAYRA